MNEFDKMDRDWEEDSGPEQVLPEKMGPAPEPWSQPETTAEPVLTGPQTEPEAEEAVPPEPPEQESFTPAEPRGEGSAPGAAQEAAGPASQEGSFFQGSGSYYTQPQQPPQPQNWGWQGQYGQYSPGWQQGGPRTTGWQQPGPRTIGWQQPGPRTTGWQQPGPQWWYPGGPAATGWQQPQQNPWQAGGYRPQGGQQVPGQWQGPPAPENAPPPKKKRGALKGFLIFLGVAAALAVVVMAGYGIYAATTGENPLAPPEGNFLPPSTSGGGSAPEIDLRNKPGTDRQDSDALDGGLTNSEIFRRVSPSVVLIVAGESSIYGEKALGSGIIMTEDGYIATNAHLVRDASDYEVVLSEGDSYKAQLVGMDNNNDLAVLKIEAQELPAAEFGDSDQTEVGERVCVIGCPLDVSFRNTLTVGYVSALNRSLRVEGRTINFIQTDAAINPGNSGGPLINAFGQVIGINSAKIILPEYEGMCFAIPISEAMPILRDLIANGKVTGRPVLGITAVAVKGTEAEYYEIPLGLWVNSITPGADIGAKGVREGDIITHIEGEPIYSVDACSQVLSRFKPGDMVSVTVFRRESVISDTTFTVEVILQSS